MQINLYAYSKRNKSTSIISSAPSRVLDAQIKDNQFINANLTFRDVTVIKKVFKKKLMNIYHVRIAYPV